MTFYEFTTRIARVRIGDDVWQSGDSVLTGEITVNLSENKSSSTGNFTLYDPGLKIAAKYRALSVKSGGIVVDNDLLNSKIVNEEKPDYVPNTSINDISGLPSPTNGQRLSWKDNEILLTREALKAGWNKNQIIYLLATALHETGDAATKHPVGDPRFLAEAGSDSYFAKYANVAGIGNNGRKDWAIRYKGRGYLQITGRGVYETTGRAIGLDLVNSPELVQNPETAAKIAVYLLSTRPPTGYKNINEFGLLTENPDFYNARRMVNSIVPSQMEQYMNAVKIYRSGGGFEKKRGQQLSNVDDLIKIAFGGSSGSAGGVKTSNNPAKNTISQSKVGDWPYPKVPATKSIIITSGHRLDISSGTNGTSNTSLNYGGENRTVESVATEIAMQVFSSEFSKAGFNVIAPPALPSSRGDNARKEYQDRVQNLKKSTGAYSLELHFDQPNGGKPGVMAGSKYDISGKYLSEMDVALAKEFGYFSFFWGESGKDVRKSPDSKLGAIIRGLTILEIDKLNQNLTNLTISGVANNNFSGLKQALLPYALRAISAFSSVMPNIDDRSKPGLRQFAKNMEGTKNSDDGKKILTAGLPEENTKKGTELIIEMMVGTSSFTELIAFHFIHTETSSSKDYGVEKTTFSGKSVRWKLTRIPQTQSFQNITLKEFAQRVAKQYNLKLKMEGQGLTYYYLPQDGQTVYQILEREARRIGFKISDSPRSNELIIEPYARPKFTSFVIDDELLISCKFSDKATGSPRYIPGASASQPEENGANNKVSINRQTGGINQSKIENKTGAMSGGVTGKSAPPAGGIVKPNNSTPTVGGIKLNQLSKVQQKEDKKSEVPSKIVEPEKATRKIFTRPDNTIVEVENKTQRTREYLKITDIETTITTIIKGTSKEVTKKKTTTVYTDAGTTMEIEETEKDGSVFSEKIETQKINKEVFSTRNLKSSINIGTVNSGSNLDDATGLPKVTPGGIDLIDGIAEQTDLLNENSRIKGYEGSLVLRTVKDVLLLVPGEVISFSPRVFNKEFATQVRIEEINHNFKDGRSTIRFYTPLQNESETPANVPNTGITDLQGKTLSDSIATPKAPSPGNNSLIMPAKGIITSGIGTRWGRMHKGVDIAANAGTPIFAPGNASVIYAKWVGGYGNQVAIALKVPNTGETVFMTFSHGQNDSFKVRGGQQVSQGQVLMLMGSTGNSTGPHLHWEIYKGGLNKILIKPSDLGYKLTKPRDPGYGI